MEELKTDRLSTNTYAPEFASGEIEVTEWLFNGISIFLLAGTIRNHATLNLKQETEGIFMCFNLSGKIKLQEKNLSKDIDFIDNQHTIFYSKGINGKLTFEPFPLKALMIQLPEKQFREIVGKDEAIGTFLKSISEKTTVQFSNQNLTIDLLLQHCIDAMLNCKYEDNLKRMFLFSKVIEILVLQIESFKKLDNIKNVYITTDYDRERILYAKDYLLKSLENPPSLKQLARIAGINEFKLKKGFKELFKQTVFEYLADVRLELGKNDLLENKKTISQIAFELGYSSLQHFSNSFKRKFGVSPNQVRKV